MATDYSWMEKTKGGKRTSAYSSPKREKVRKEKGNVVDVIREKQRKTHRQAD